jgi:pimeloyl-ACP methyl ester carboxylesterase
LNIARSQLLVFLPGTGGKASGTEKFNKLAANEGFHVVCLQYPDNFSISHYHESADPDAFAKARENIISGAAPIGKLHVNQPNSIENRLVKLLKYLSADSPSEHWGQFLSEKESVDWENLILAGSSQGGGHAAFMAMKHKVAGVLTFGAPKDFNVHFNQPAKWYSGPSETALNRFFSFVHSADEGHGCSYAQSTLADTRRKHIDRTGESRCGGCGTRI